ncbi:MAG: hypothetical protein AAGA10_29880 [Bacteroidota bacterium]
MKRIFLLMLALLLVCLTLTGVLALLPPQVQPTGTIHPEYASLMRSGTSVWDSPIHKGIAIGFGVAILGLFGLTLYIGGYKQEDKKRKKIYTAFAVGMVAYYTVFFFLLSSYGSYHIGENPTFFGGLPAPSAWMMYGIWFIPVLISGVYIVKFSDWVLSPEEHEAFQEIVRRRKNSR